MNLDTHLTLVGLVCILDGIGLDLTIVQGDALSNLVHVVSRDILVEEHVIDLLLEELGMGKFAGEVAIVGKQEHTGGIAVETANGIDTLRASIFHQVHHSLALLWVVAGSDIVFGLVEQHVDLLLKAYGLIVEHHLVGARHLGAQFGHHLSVDGHHTCLDICIGLTTAANAGIGKILVEADGLIGVDMLLLVLNTFLQTVFGIGIVSGIVLTIATLIVSALLIAAALLVTTLLTGLVAATLLVTTLLTGLIATLLTGLIATLLTGLIATLLTGLIATLLTGLIATLLTGLVTTLLTGLIATTLLVTALLAGLVATLLAVAHIIVVTRTVGTLSASRLKTCPETLGAESALIVIVSFAGISALSVNARTHHALTATIVLRIVP